MVSKFLRDSLKQVRVGGGDKLQVKELQLPHPPPSALSSKKRCCTGASIAICTLKGGRPHCPRSDRGTLGPESCLSNLQGPRSFD